MKSFPRIVTAMALLSLIAWLGCDSGMREVREIQQRRDQQRLAATEEDHLREAFGFVAQSAELDPETAQRRIAGLLNSWLDTHPMPENWTRPEILGTLEAPWANGPALERLDRPRYTPDDVQYLRLNFLLKRLSQWVGDGGVDDPVWTDWLRGLEDQGEAERAGRLRQVIRLFDWTTRNIALEPAVPEDRAPPAPAMPAGLEFRGPGYRQSTYETLLHGSGDGLQRGRVFIQLCRQVGVDACYLAPAGQGDAAAEPWAVGVRLGEDLYLFEPELGVPIPGPDQVGIATLQQARQDPAVLRRMNVPGWFDYPIDASQIQNCVALLDAPIDSLARNMAHLESGLVGETRMVLAYDADASAAALDALPGIVGVRLWPIDIQVRVYREALERAAASDQMIAAWMASHGGLLSETFPLARARWKHLTGQFQSEDDEIGAQVMYMQLRLPEFDIERLPGSPELQEKYDPILRSRRLLGETEEGFAQRMARMQYYLRLSKRAATYWISLIHYDNGAFDTSRSWLEKRVLVDDLDSRWKAPARYNLARCLEQQGETESAVEYLKTIGDVQEHGNRIRARLLEP